MPDDQQSANRASQPDSKPTSTLDALAARLIRRARTIRVLRSAGIIGAYGAALAAALLLSVALGLFRVDPWQLLGLYGAAVAVAGCAAAIGFRKTRARALLDADLAYETKELLSTAYGELRHRPDSPFTKSLAAKATALAEQVVPSRVYSSRLVRPVAAPAALFLLAATAIVMGWIAPAASIPVGNPRAAQMLEELGSRLAAEAAPQEDSAGREVARELQELGERLADGGLDDEDRERARELLPRIEEQIDSLSRSNLPEATRSSEQLAEAEELVRGILGEGGENMNEFSIATPGGGAGDSSPDRSVDGEGSGGGSGERATDGEDGDSGAEAQRQNPGDRRGSPSDLRSGTQRGNASRPQPGGGSAELDRGDGGEAGGRQDRSGAAGGTSPDAEGNAGSGDSPGGGASAGADAGSRTEEGDEELEAERQERAASRLESQLGDGDVLRLYVRRLAERAESELPEASIGEEYQTAIESAIGRQSVPARAETLVRDYFVVLGVAQRNQSQSDTGE